MNLTQPPRDAPHEPARLALVRGDPLREGQGLAPVAGGKGVGEVVSPGRHVARGEALHVLEADTRGGMHPDRELLDLARETLLVRSDQGYELLGRLRIELHALLPRALDRPLGEVPRLGGGVLATASAGLLDRRG